MESQTQRTNARDCVMMRVSFCVDKWKRKLDRR